MTKLIPILIDNQRIIQLSQLTVDQANDLRSFLPVSSIRQLIYEGMELTDCIDFETYEYWFQSNHVGHYSASTIWDI
ncbi:hypothetical protein GCM10007049_09810 [Echinicola pacifica]|uniref:Uncharacterized protein n=1 Tax=Echinicola pacifica TaxID=346377 RepID=A0A918PQK3_9BACT|nr:hypothetical protein [Echinicola pacifica]GGZ19430.1 hypothetical protein GCM10007049_09810 [Echinicola pacifica]